MVVLGTFSITLAGWCCLGPFSSTLAIYMAGLLRTFAVICGHVVVLGHIPYVHCYISAISSSCVVHARNPHDSITPSCDAWLFGRVRAIIVPSLRVYDLLMILGDRWHLCLQKLGSSSAMSPSPAGAAIGRASCYRLECSVHEWRRKKGFHHP